MGVWPRVRRFLGLPATRATFSDSPSSIGAVIWEMGGRSGRRVTRVEALGVPAVLRGRNMICSISTLPLVQTNAAGIEQRSSLLEQIDPNVPNIVTLAQTVEDLLFESVAWWRVTARDPAGFPTSARHLDPSQVSLDPPAGHGSNPLPSALDPRGVPYVYVEGVRTSAADVIRFDSSNPALLVVGRKAIRRAILLDAAASMYAEDPQALDYFTPAENADELDDDEADTIIAAWRASRKKRATAWIPRSMEYHTVDSPSPQQLQLVELQERAALDIANALGVDPEDLGVSTTSRTYANVVDRRQDKINEVLAPYMLGITQRLSMGDVTRRGHVVAFGLNGYLRTNPVDRANIDKTYFDAKAITRDEMRAGRGLPPLTDAQRAELEPAPAPVPPAPPVDPAADVDQIDAKVEEWRTMSKATRKTFSGFEAVTLDVPVRGFTVDRQRRTVEGIALPYGHDQVATKYGMSFRFIQGSLSWSSVNRVKLLRDHDMGQLLGVGVELTDTAAGLRVKFKVARGAPGDTALSLAEDGVLDGMSVGVDFGDEDMMVGDDGVINVTRADLREVSLTAFPAFDDARLTKVTAARFQKGSTVKKCSTCGADEHAGACAAPPNPPTQQQPTGVQLSDEQMRVIFAQPGALQALVAAAAAPQQPAQPDGALTLSAEQIGALAQSGALATLFGLPGVMRPAPQQPHVEEGPIVVDPTRRTASVVVSEEDPYRFDRGGRLTKGTQYDFATDLIAGLKDKNEEALKRATAFVSKKFDIVNVEDTTDVASLNPSRQRPEMYVDQKDFLYPFYTFCLKGGLDDNTPFIFPVFSSATGLVGAHTEGTEPTGGEYKTTSTTVTPSGLSGKAVIDREVWDAGGNPRVSDLLWKAMLRGWYEGMEAAVVTMLNGTTLTAQTITLVAGATDTDLTAELEGKLALLNFVRGGFTMRDLFLQADLFLGLSGAVDGIGRPRYPVIGAQNATGTAGELWGSLNINGVAGRPSWALAAQGQTSATPSYLLDKEAVSFWASAPQRLSFEYQVKSVELGIWGYKAGVVNDVTGVRKINWDPTA